MYTFIHVNKCGGKSLDSVLVKMLTRKNYREIHGLVGTPVTTRTAGKLILFVRDPIERAISGFHYYRMRKRLYSIDFNEYIQKTKFDNTHMTYSLSWYIKPETISKLDFFFVGTLENMDEDYKRLTATLGIKDPVPLPHKNMTIRLDRKLTETNVNHLKQFYKNDYECLRILDERGLLPKGYYENVCNRVDYKY